MWCQCRFLWLWGQCIAWRSELHYSDVIKSRMASQITSLTIVYSAVYSGTDQIKHQSSASPAFVRGINRWPLNSPHKAPVTPMFPSDDVIMILKLFHKWIFKLLLKSCKNLFGCDFYPTDKISRKCHTSQAKFWPLLIIVLLRKCNVILFLKIWILGTWTIS